MKKLILSLFVLTTSIGVFAQTDTEDIDMMQAAFGKEKKQLMQEFVQVDATNKDAFWALYNEYETKRKELGKDRIKLIKTYAANYATMNDAKITEIIKAQTKMASSYEKLISTYFGKMSKSVGVKPAAQFYQLESYLLSVMRVEIMNNIPFIGELDY